MTNLSTNPQANQQTYDPSLDELLDQKQAAAFLGLQPRTMEKFRRVGGGPLYVRISARCVRYRRRDLNNWTESKIEKNNCAQRA